MHLHPRLVLFLAPTTLMTACGASSGLPDIGTGGAAASNAATDGSSNSASTVGSGSGHSTGGSSSSGGQGGAGGAFTAVCTVDGPPLVVAPAKANAFDGPVLLGAGDGTTATLLGLRQDPSPSAPAPLELRHTTFAPWGAWPAEASGLPSFVVKSSVTIDAFQAAPTVGGFGLFIETTTSSQGLKDNLRYLAPTIPGAPSTPSLFPQIQGNGVAAFIAQGAQPAEHLFGILTDHLYHRTLDLILFNEETAATTPLSNLICVYNGFQVADAAWSAGGYLVAATSASAFESPACALEGWLPDGTPHLAILRVTKDGAAKQVTTLESDGPVNFRWARVSPRSDGAWISWLGGDFGHPRIEVARVDAGGALVVGPIVVPSTGNINNLAATSIGNRLALAWSASAPDESGIHVTVLDDSGAAAATTTIDATTPPDARIGLLAAPSANAMLVGWLEESTYPGDLRVARVGCAFP